jgi:streptogramin lyase
MSARSIPRRIRRTARLVATVAALALPVSALAPAAQAAPTIREIPVPTPSSAPSDITVGPDGAVWFTERDADKIGRVKPNGQITEFQLPAGREPNGITAGPDGAVWFAETGADRIGRLTPNGNLHEFRTRVTGSAPTQITLGPDGNLWFTETLADRIGMVTPTGVFTEVFTGISSINPEDITTGPDGALWFTAFPDPEGTSPGWVGRITTTFQITLFPTSTFGDDVTVPLGIASGPDGNLWITGPGNGTIGKVTTSGQVTVFHLPQGVVSSPAFITVGADGALWFTEQGLAAGVGDAVQAGGNKIGRITTAGTIQEIPVPTPNSAPLGITLGPDHRIWITESAGNKLGRVSPGA